LAGLYRAGTGVAASWGHGEGKLALGPLLAAEPGRPDAVRWFRAAAEQGLPAAQYELGQALAHGAGVPRDDEAEAAR
jgi:hypothetical protein